jgi:hypothetical protein
MPLRGVDSDNGSEFINHDLGASARASPSPAAAPIRRTTAPMSSRRTARSSAPLIGYDRYARAAYAQLARVYALARLHINFFQPVQKLVTKERRGPRVHRVYDRAQTPYQRLRATGGLPGARRQELEVLFSASTSCTCAARSRRPWSGSGPWRSRPGRPQRHPRKTPRRGSTTTHSASGRRTRCRRRLPGTRTHCRRNRVVNYDAVWGESGMIRRGGPRVFRPTAHSIVHTAQSGVQCPASRRFSDGSSSFKGPGQRWLHCLQCSRPGGMLPRENAGRATEVLDQHAETLLL